MQVPDEISFADQSGASICRGTQTLRSQLTCSTVSETQREINLLSDTGSFGALANGTTIQYQIGYIRNPMSLRSSSYFYFATYDGDYMVNESKNQARITNSESGPITLTSYESRNPELGARSQMIYEFTTQSAIPSTATLIFTLPANVVVEDQVRMLLLGEEV